MQLMLGWELNPKKKTVDLDPKTFLLTTHLIQAEQDLSRLRVNLIRETSFHSIAKSQRRCMHAIKYTQTDRTDLTIQ